MEVHTAVAAAAPPSPPATTPEADDVAAGCEMADVLLVVPDVMAGAAVAAVPSAAQKGQPLQRHQLQ